MRLQGKTAIVTGGASGFGAGITRKFVAEGANVMIADLNIDMANELAVELGDRVKTVQTNVAQNDSVMDMVTATLKAFGKIGILINNAGTTHLPAPMEDVTEDDFDKVFAGFEPRATDSEISALSDTRTARAFMLLGRVAGTFD